MHIFWDFFQFIKWKAKYFLIKFLNMTSEKNDAIGLR